MSPRKERPKYDPDAAAAAHDAEMEQRRSFVMPPEIPRFSIGAFFMPPIWGAGHGQWITLLFYPLWVFADSVFRYAWFKQTAGFIVGAVFMFALMLGATLFYASTAQKPAYYRVRDKYTPERYVKRERVWNIVMVLIGIAFLALATYYNLVLFDPATLSFS